jgi:hypothetical protein
MADKDILGARGRRCTVYLEACDDGVTAKTRLKALVRDQAGVHVVTRIFDSLDEALAYAQTLYQAAA